MEIHRLGPDNGLYVTLSDAKKLETQRDQIRYVLEKIYNSGQWYLSALEIDLNEEGAIDGETLERMACVVLRETEKNE